MNSQKSLLLFFIASAIVAYPYFILTAYDSSFLFINSITFAPSILQKNGDNFKINQFINLREGYCKWRFFDSYYDLLKSGQYKIRVTYKVAGKNPRIEDKMTVMGVNAEYLLYKSLDLTEDCDDDKAIGTSIEDISRSDDGFELIVNIVCSKTTGFDKLQQLALKAVDEVDGGNHYKESIVLIQRRNILV